MDPITEYARQAAKGKVPHPFAGRKIRKVCKLEQLSAERHLEDMRTAKKRELRFDLEAAASANQFFGHLCHYKGEFAGKPLELSPWQKFIIGSLMGWKRADGTRRFREAYEEVPRKNGKSTKDAGLGILLAFFDGEPAAEVYCAATKKEQAQIVFGDAKQMVMRSPALKKRIQVLTNNLNIPKTASKMQALGADQDTMDGLNVHGAIVDEVHQHRNSGVIDALRTATGSRRQPLIKHVTTAGFDRQSVCWKLREYSSKVLEGHVPDDSFFAFIAGVDQGDDWQDPDVWFKANPNLGVSAKLEDIQRLALQAKHMPSAENSFRRKRLNEWTEQSERAIPMELWKACGGAVDADELRGRACFGGLKISPIQDLSAFVLVFPSEGNAPWQVLSWFFAPADDVLQRSQNGGLPYQEWARQGLLEETPGNGTDARRIGAKVMELAGVYQIRQVAYSRSYAGEVIEDLMNEGLEMIPIGQTFLTMNAPTSELLRRLKAKGIRHGDHPILSWNASNLAVKTDAQDNVMPDHEASLERIDGIVALLNATDRILRADPPPDGNVYNERAENDEEVLRFV